MGDVEDEEAVEQATGVLITQGGCVTQEVRNFLQSERVTDPDGTPDGSQDVIPFHVLPGYSVAEAVAKGSIECPALWVDAAEATRGIAPLHLVYCLGAGLQHYRLPLKPIKLQPVRKAPPNATAGPPGGLAVYRAFLPAKSHLLLFRLVHSLGPTLQRWQLDLQHSGVHVVNLQQPSTDAVGVEQVRAMPDETGLLLERHDVRSGVTAKLRVGINIAHACLELREASAGAPATSRCLRTVNTLEEAVGALQGRATQLVASPSVSPTKAATRHASQFDSPSKPPRRAVQGEHLARQGVSLVQACSSAQLREGATMLQAAAAATPSAAAVCIEHGAMEAMVRAAGSVLPNSITGTTEQLTLLVLTVTTVLDAAPASACGPASLVAAMASTLLESCANPLLLCKLLVALLQRPDVRVEAMRQDLASTISDAYLRKSRLLEPLARALLSPSTLAQRWRAAAGADDVGSPGAVGTPGDAAAQPVAEWQTPPLASARGLSIPRLALPTDGDAPEPTPKCGLTRATRRELSATPPGSGDWRPGDWRSAGGAWDSPHARSEGKEASAAAEMGAMAEALGESLMAADLPAVVAHKRRADLLLEQPLEDAIPSDLLDPLLSGGRQSSVLAHAIFTTARSMRSIDSSPEGSLASANGHGSGMEHEGGSDALYEVAACEVQLADTAEVKVLLLTALTAALPVMGAGGFPARDPSPVLAAEVLAMANADVTAAQEQLRGACLRALACLAQQRQPGQKQSPAAPPVQHVFVAAVGSKVAQFLAGGLRATPLAVGQAVHHLHLVSEYVESVQAPAAAAAVAQHCLAAVQAAMAVLHGAGPSPAEWQRQSWELLHCVLNLLDPACTHCADPAAGRALLSVTLGDYRVASMLMAAAETLLLRPETIQQCSAAHEASLLPLQRDLLSCLSALAGLVSRQPGVGRESSSSLDPGSDVLLAASTANGFTKLPSRRLTRRHALNFFAFLVTPGGSFVRRILEHDGGVGSADGAPPLPPAAPASGSTVRLRQALLELLRAVFAAPGSPFVAHKPCADFYVRFHFIQFLKLYHNPERDHQALFLCRQHLAALLVLAGAGALHLRHRFQQLSVVDFFVRELSLELEARQQGVRRAGRRGFSSFGSVSELGVVAAAGKYGTPASNRDSPLGSPHGTPALGKAAHRRSQSQSSISAVGRLPEDQGGGSAGSKGSKGLSLVPKLRLGGGEASSASPASPQSTGSARRGGLPLPLLPSSRLATSHATSRLGREAAATSAAAAGRSGSKPPAVPKLGLAGLGRTDPGEPQLAPLDSPAESSARGERISSMPGVPLPPLGAPYRDPAGGAVQTQHSAEPKRLESVVSAAISLDSGWPLSGRSGVGAGGVSVDEEQPAAPLVSASSFPRRFVFSGDLDEDVELLEAMEEGSDDGDAVEASSSSSDSDGDEKEPASAAPPRLLPALSFPSRAVSSPEEVAPQQAQPPPLPQSAPASDHPADAPPPQTPPPPAAVLIPRLSITGSMHSTLEARCASAELQVVVEAERQRRKAGRSFFGDLEKRALGKGKMQAATRPPPSVGRRVSHTTADLQAAGGGELEISYAEERRRRVVYQDEGLHLSALQLVFTLILDPRGQLDPAYTDQYPWDRKLQNIPFVLHHHLNHPDNRPLLPRLLPRLHALGAPALRLLRTLCSAFFRPQWYAARARISGVAGAYATVYRCHLPPWAGGASVVLKLLDTPKHIQDRCAQVDFHSEVTILDTLAGNPAACALCDYGVDLGADAMCLVLKDYRCSLKQWRARQPAPPATQLRLYFAIFREVVVAVAALLEAGVVHFDLKCDNILLEPLPGASEEEFWAPRDQRPPFRVVLADFGESKLFPPDADAGSARAGRDGVLAEGGTTSRARGTDCFKSPEMLMVGSYGAGHKGQRGYDRRRRQGAGAASDVWSLGCVLYELVAGLLLFSDSDWLQLVARVTSANMQLITDDKAAAVAGLPGVHDLLQFMLVRDATLRPTLRDTLVKLDAILEANTVAIPQHQRRRDVAAAAAAAAEAWAPSPLQAALLPGAAAADSPLPLTTILPFLPSLLLGPVAAVQQRELREHSVRSVVVLLRPATSAGDAWDSADEGAPSADGSFSSLDAAVSPPPTVTAAQNIAKQLTFGGMQGSPDSSRGGGSGSTGTVPVHLDSEQQKAALLCVLADKQLSECAEVCGAAGAECTAIFAAGAADVAGAARWLDAALPVLCGTAAGTGPVLLVAQAGREGDLALLAVAYLARSQRLSPYRAMVGAAQWGVDLYLRPEHMEVVARWAAK